MAKHTKKQISIPLSLHAKAKAAAATKQIPLGQLAEMALAEYLKTKAA